MQDRADTPSDRQQTWAGMNDGLALGMEMAVAPVVFALIGLWIDSVLGTTPGFAVGLAMFGMIGGFVKAYYIYTFKTAATEVERPWSSLPQTRPEPAQKAAPEGAPRS